MSLPQLLADYRYSAIILGKIGFKASEVWTMSLFEMDAWLKSYLETQGIKPKASRGNSTHYILQRKKKQ